MENLEKRIENLEEQMILVLEIVKQINELLKRH